MNEDLDLDSSVLCCTEKVEELIHYLNHSELQKRIEALRSLGSLFLLETNAKDCFHDNEGAKVIIDRLRIEDHREFVENAFALLACGASNHIGNQKSLTKGSMFSLFCAIFKHPDILHFQRMCKSALLLLLTIVNENVRGQFLIRESGCLNQLILLFQSNLYKIDKFKDSTYEFLHYNLNLMSSILVSSVNNPKNEKNQTAVAEVFSKALPYLSSVDYNDNKSIEPVRLCLKIFAGVIYDNKTNQDRFVNCGGISGLKRLLYALKCSTTEHPLLETFLMLLDVLVTSNAFCSHNFSSLRIVPHLLEILQKNTKVKKEKLNVLLLLYHLNENNNANKRSFIENNGHSIIQKIFENNLNNEDILLASAFLLKTCIPHEKESQSSCVIRSSNENSLFEEDNTFKWFQAERPMRETTRVNIASSNISSLDINQPGNEITFRKQNRHYTHRKRNALQTDEKLCKRKLLMHDGVISGLRKRINADSLISESSTTRNNCKSNSTFLSLIHPNQNLTVKTFKKHMNSEIQKPNSQLEKESANSYLPDNKVPSSSKNVSDCLNSSNLNDLIGIINFQIPSSPISLQINILSKDKNKLLTCSSNNKLPEINPLSAIDKKKVSYTKSTSSYSEITSKCGSGGKLVKSNQEILNKSNSTININSVTPEKEVSIQASTILEPKKVYVDFEDFLILPEPQNLGNGDMVSELIKKSNDQEIQTESIDALSNLQQPVVHMTVRTKCDEPVKGSFSRPKNGTNFDLQKNEKMEIELEVIHMERSSINMDKNNEIKTPNVNHRKMCEPIQGNFSSPKNYTSFDLQNNENMEIEQAVIHMEKSSINLDKSKKVKSPKVVYHKMCEPVQGNFSSPKNYTSFDLQNNENIEIEQAVIHMERSSINMDKNNEIKTPNVNHHKMCEPIQGNFSSPKNYTSFDLQNNENTEIEQAVIHMESSSKNLDKNNEVETTKELLVPKVLKNIWRVEKDSINNSPLTSEEMKNLQLGIKQFGLNFVAIRKAYSFSTMRTSKELFMTWRNELQNEYPMKGKMLEINSDESMISECC